MKTIVQTAVAALAFSALAAGAAAAAEACCCKDKEAPMACCDKKGEPAPNASPGASQHQH